MKKIIFAALAVLMMLGFAGCSGNLHDYVDLPPAGTWFYVDAELDATGGLIAVTGDADKTGDLSFDISTGSAYYLYNGKDDYKEYTGANKPASQAGRIWVVSTLPTLKVYYWGSAKDCPEAYPGITATKSEFVLEN